MAAQKKSSPQSSNAAEKRTAKKKAAPQSGTVKPTAAFTAKGQKATGLAQRPAAQRKGGIMSTNPKQTKVKTPTGFAGSGAPFNSMPMMAGKSSKEALVGGVLLVTMMPGKGKIASAIASRVGAKAGDAAYGAAAKGLGTATGRGGRVSKTFTPFGPTIRSTQIGTKAQQGSRIENLMANAQRIATQTERGTAAAVKKSITSAGQKTRIATAVGGATYSTRRKPKKKK